MPNERFAKIKALMQEKRSHTVRGRPSFWKPARLIQRVSNFPTVQSWLSTKDSLTQRIRQTCPQMTVQVLSEQTERPLLDECTALGLSANDLAWVRCVLLKCDDQNWVYARTVIPNLTPESPWTSLQKLGNQPLGEVLFDLPSIQRTPFEFSSQGLSTWPYLSEQIGAENSQGKGYARRSIFTQKEAPLLLTEVFLPGLVGL
jgi:chorismate--pyruvate lyase